MDQEWEIAEGCAQRRQVLVFARIDDAGLPSSVAELNQQELWTVAMLCVELGVHGHGRVEIGHRGVQVVDDQGAGLYQAECCWFLPALRRCRPPSPQGR